MQVMMTSLNQMGIRMRITNHPKLQVIQVNAMKKIHVDWKKIWKTMCSKKSCLP